MPPSLLLRTPPACKNNYTSLFKVGILHKNILTKYSFIKIFLQRIFLFLCLYFRYFPSQWQRSWFFPFYNVSAALVSRSTVVGASFSICLLSWSSMPLTGGYFMFGTHQADQVYQQGYWKTAQLANHFECFKYLASQLLLIKQAAGKLLTCRIQWIDSIQ